MANLSEADYKTLRDLYTWIGNAPIPTSLLPYTLRSETYLALQHLLELSPIVVTGTDNDEALKPQRKRKTL